MRTPSADELRSWSGVDRLAEEGQPPVENYSVYTGYAGWGGSQVLPTITVDMRSYTRHFSVFYNYSEEGRHKPMKTVRNFSTPEERPLRGVPPPSADSPQRLNTLLKSIGLRPTDLPMPELAPGQKKQ